MKGRRLIFWGVLALLLAAGLFVALRPQPVPVDMIQAERGSLVVTVDEEGETRVKDVFVLSAPIAGRTLRIDLEAGDPVEADRTVVATIEPIDPAFLDVRSEAEGRAAVVTAEAALRYAQAEVDKAEAELDFAFSELERARFLIKSNTISERALDTAERGYRTERAALETAKAALRMRESELTEARTRLMQPVDARRRPEDCDCVEITAPVGGRILRVLQESERVVQPGDALVEIGDPAELEIVVDLLSEDAVKVEPGQRVILEQWGGGVDLEGRVQRVEPYGFTKVSALGIEEQRVNVIVDFVGEPAGWRRLGHGFRVEARIVLWESDDVLRVPLTALFREGQDWAVFVDSGGRAEKRQVRIGQRNGLEAEILEGLAGGEQVVLHPSDRVIDGVALTPRS